MGEKMKGQMSIFDFLTDIKPGDYVKEDKLGKILSFDDLQRFIGKIIILDESTVSTKWYQAARLEGVIPHERARRAICYTGKRQRNFIDERIYERRFYELRRGRKDDKQGSN